MSISEAFARFSTRCARFSGKPVMQVICGGCAALGVAAYLSGDEHFLNGAILGISIVTLLLLPLLQASQNRDGAAMRAKLDELIKVNVGAQNALIGLENRSEEEIETVRREEEAP